MTVDPRNIPATQTTEKSPASASECRRHITALLTLAGKLDGSCATPEGVKTFLIDHPEMIAMATELLTSTDQDPTGRSFDQLFPQSAIDDYRDSENRPLPGAEPHVCGPTSTNMVEIDPDSVLCNPAARHDYVQRMLIPQATRRVTAALQEVITKDELQKLQPEHLTQLTKLSERLAQKQPFSGSPCFTGSMPEGAINPPYVTA